MLTRGNINLKSLGKGRTVLSITEGRGYGVFITLKDTKTEKSWDIAEALKKQLKGYKVQLDINIDE